MRIQDVFVLLVVSTIASPLNGGREHNMRRDVQYKVNHQRADAVKEAFTFAWSGYYRYAFPNDELHPVSNGYGNSRNGWGATTIDALSTAIVMELGDIVNTIVDYVPSINWHVTNDQVSVFETTIRYLGGLLAGYDLLQGPFDYLLNEPTKTGALLSQAKTLADALSYAFDTESGIPDNMINITSGALMTPDGSTGIAVAGSLVMEWTRLSDILGDPKYANLAQRAEDHLLNPVYDSPLSEPFPGLEGSSLNYHTGRFTNVAGGWVGGADSFYEYLIKMWVYDNEKYAQYSQRWQDAADSSIRHLGSHPSSRPDLTFIAQYNGKDLIFESEHLACFAGGNFLLGGLVLGQQKYIDFGLELTAGCHDTYISDSTRIGPEVFDWIPSTCLTNGSYFSSPVGKRNGPPKPNAHKAKRGEHHYNHEIYHTLTETYAPAPTVVNDIDDAACAATDACDQATATEEAPVAYTTNCVVPVSESAFYQNSGFYVTVDSYDLRPETMESYYYAYRITGDPKYQEWAWDAFLAINTTARIGSGFSAFSGVNSNSVSYGDNQESFFFAEVMKYAYLIHAPDGPWQVNYEGSGKNEFVYNTEAHPFKARKPPGKPDKRSG